MMRCSLRWRPGPPTQACYTGPLYYEVPATRAHSDRTVGIDVCRWRVGGGSQLVANIYDAAGQRVYRATHELFMSLGALYLHAVRMNQPEDAAGAGLVEWVCAVQQEAPGAVMGIMWTHMDVFAADQSEEARAWQARVLERVRHELDSKARDVDEALREMEGDMTEGWSTRDGPSLSDEWERARVRRDAALAELDRLAMMGCQVEACTIWGRQELHLDYACDGCKVTPIVGALWKCRLCADFDLCDACYSAFSGRANTSIHIAGHTFFQSEEPEEKIYEDVLDEGWTADIQCMVEAQNILETQHAKMKAVETKMAGSTANGQDNLLAEQLERLRNQRVRRPRIVFHHSVSNLTGQGLEDLRGALKALMGDKRLFPHVGMQVPLNYSMLERLAQEGRLPSKDDEEDEVDREKDGRKVESDRAEWEMAVTRHVAEKCTPELRAVCSQAYASLGDLLEKAGQVGMDRHELLSALRFLHETGSVLHYGEGTRRGNAELHKTVFMRPQFIIDGIKCIIREPGADDINDELRQMDTRIRQTSERESLDQYLGAASQHGAGVLTRRLLLRHLWWDVVPRDREVLLHLMKAFKLLRELDANTFLVPAMLPKNRDLPAEYVSPDWWCPRNCETAAVMQVEGT
jgi:hypothetical protein